MRCQDTYTNGRKKGQQCESEATEDGIVYCANHARWQTAHIARLRGLRTVAKPGDPDFKAKDDKPFCDDRVIEGVNEPKA